MKTATKLLRDKWIVVLVLMTLVYAFYFSFITIQRHNNIHSDYYDLGIMHQVVHNSAHGRFMQLSFFDSPQAINRFAVHSDLLLGLLAPFYWIYDGVETLLVIQSFASAIGAIGLYAIARKLDLSKFVGVAFAFAYLLYPPLQRANMYDFHAVVLGTGCLIFMVAFAMHKKYRLSFLCALLAIFSKENVALATGFFGFFVALPFALKNVKALSKFSKIGNFLKLPGISISKKSMEFGLLLWITSIVWFVLVFWVLIPHFRGEIPNTEYTRQHFAIERYSYLGSSVEGIVKNSLVNPGRIVNQLSQEHMFSYIENLFQPVAWLSVFSPTYLLIIVPELAINMLSTNTFMQDIRHQYTAVVTPFIFISAIAGFGFISRKFPRLKASYLAVFLIVFAVGMNYVSGPLGYAKLPEESIQKAAVPEKHAILYRSRMLKDSDAVITTSGSLGPHFSGRETYFRFSKEYKQADYILLLISEVKSDWYDSEGSLEAYESLQNDPMFSRIDQVGDFEVYKKN